MPSTLLSVNNYYYARGGSELVFFGHNEMFEEKGWSVVPFCMTHARNAESEHSGDFVDEIELGEAYSVVEKISKGVKAVYSFEARRKVSRVLDRIAPDVCHAHNVYHHISPSIFGEIRRRGVPIVMTLHDLKIACPAHSMLSRDGVCERCRGGRFYNVATNRCIKGSVSLSALVMVESYLHNLLGSYSRNVDRFVVPSRFYLEKLVEWGFDSERMVYVPNFVDASRFEPVYEPGERFVYFGRLAREKGLTTLIDAAAAAGVGLDLIGTGPLEGELRRRVALAGCDAVFHGYLSGSDLHDAIAAARAVVVPSEWYENAPLSVLEAGALGKPIIAADIGGLPEIVEDGESGWIFEPGSVDELADRLRRIARLPQRDLRRAGMASRDRVVAHYSPQRYLDAMQGIYRELGVQWH